MCSSSTAELAPTTGACQKTRSAGTLIFLKWLIGLAARRRRLRDRAGFSAFASGAAAKLLAVGSIQIRFFGNFALQRLCFAIVSSVEVNVAFMAIWSLAWYASRPIALIYD